MTWGPSPCACACTDGQPLFLRAEKWCRVLEKGGEGWDVLGTEGCLSVPDYVALVRRNRWILVQYDTLAGNTVTARVSGTCCRLPCNSCA